MRQSYYKTLTHRAVTFSNSKGAISESIVDTTFQGFIGVLSANEILVSQKLEMDATARMYADTLFKKSDKIVDTSGYFSGEAGQVYEIVGVYNSGFDIYYDLKIVRE